MTFEQVLEEWGRISLMEKREHLRMKKYVQRKGSTSEEKAGGIVRDRHQMDECWELSVFSLLLNLSGLDLLTRHTAGQTLTLKYSERK